MFNTDVNIDVFGSYLDVLHLSLFNVYFELKYLNFAWMRFIFKINHFIDSYIFAFI